MGEILQARRLERVAISSSRRPSRPRDRTWSPALKVGSLPTELPVRAWLDCMLDNSCWVCLRGRPLLPASVFVLRHTGWTPSPESWHCFQGNETVPESVPAPPPEMGGDIPNAQGLVPSRNLEGRRLSRSGHPQPMRSKDWMHRSSFAVCTNMYLQNNHVTYIWAFDTQ